MEWDNFEQHFPKIFPVTLATTNNIISNIFGTPYIFGELNIFHCYYSLLSNVVFMKCK